MREKKELWTVQALQDLPRTNYKGIAPKVWTNNDDYYEQEYQKNVKALQLKKERMKRFGGARMAAQATEGAVTANQRRNQKGAGDKNILKDKFVESVPPPRRYRTRKQIEETKR